MTCSPIKVLLLAFTTLFLISCTGEDRQIDDVNTLRPNINQNVNINENANNNANVAQDDSIKLNELINLPYEPEESPFREDDIKNEANSNATGTPEGKKLTAVIKFSEEDTQALLSELEQTKSYKMKIEPDPWFPAELIAKSDMSGDQSISGTGFSADKFFKPPYNAGSIIQINQTNYFVLILREE